MLISTKCGEFCEFSKITTFCFDCPGLMCAQCDREIHRQKNHTSMLFQNNNLRWSDKSLIMSLFEDDSLALKVFKEVSRDVSASGSSRNTFILRIPEPKNSKDTLYGWTCTTCTFINKSNQIKCFSCSLYRVVEDYSGQYNSKLDSYMKKINNLFIELEKYENVPMEHVISEFMSSAKTTLDIDTWFKQRYSINKSLSIINEVINLHGHRLSMNDLEENYYKLIKEKNDNILKMIPKSLKEKIDRNSKDLIQLSNINKKFNIANNAEVTDQDIWQIITKDTDYIKRERRMLITELNLPNPEKVTLLRVMINHLELGPYLKDNCPDGVVKLSHVRQTLVDQILIEDMINFLKKECGVCSEDFPMPMMHPMLICEHELCKECFKNWLSSNINDRYPCKWMCPLCPEENQANVDKNLYYCNLREFLRQNNCGPELIGIFDEKLLKERLQGSPLFHWCANDKCENGFEAEGVNNKIQCPSCHMHMCVLCNREWKKEHENATCQEYEMFMLKNDPDLAKILNEIGIECPKCAMRYALAPGGCLHFDCRTCSWVFCGSCYEEFTKNCKDAACQMGTAFHAHHPRNCFYYMRDYTPAELENMLKNVDYPKLINKPEKKCPFQVAEKKTLINRACDVPVYATCGLCETHYKEYLAQFINRFKVDPADFVDDKALNIMLFQGRKPRLENKGETKEAFLLRLRNEVKKTCSFYVPKGLEIPAPKA